MTIDTLKAMVYRKAQEKGIANLWPIIEGIITRESGWNPQAHNTTGEDSVGLFQMNRAGGLGTGYTVVQLMNPETNAEAALNVIASRAQQGMPTDTIFRDWTTAPAAMTAAQGGGNMTTPAQQTPIPTQQTATTGAVRQWMRDTLGMTDDEIKEEFAAGGGPAWAKLYLSVVGGTSAMTPYEAGSLAVSQGNLGVSQGNLALAQQDAELARAYKEIEAKVASGEWDSDRATAEYTAVATQIQNRMTEAGARGQYVQGVLEDRAKLTTNTPYFPGFEPGGLAQQIMGRRGLTAPTLQGTPTSQLPDPWAAFQQGNESVGLPAQTPGIAPYPQATNPYNAVMPQYEQLAGGQNPFAQFQNMGADVNSGVSPGGTTRNYLGPDIMEFLKQFGIQLPGAVGL